jgi:hypothetical protein
VKNRSVPSAMPEASNAIRIAFDEDEPPAIVFNESAHPGALISWAWCQLIALDTLLAAVSETRRTAHEEDVAGAARSVLGPAINALVFAERRADELQEGRKSSVRRRGDRKKKERRG